MPRYRRCLKCACIKQTTEFYKHIGFFLGVRAHCKACEKILRYERQKEGYESGRLLSPAVKPEVRKKSRAKKSWYSDKYPYQEDMWSAERLADFKKYKAEVLAKNPKSPGRPKGPASSKLRREALRASAEEYLRPSDLRRMYPPLSAAGLQGTIRSEMSQVCSERV